MTFVFSKGFLLHNVLKGLNHSKFKPINSSFDWYFIKLPIHLNVVRVTGSEGNVNAIF